ncbi:MAG: hypothetical protein ACRELF_26290 [Gemmataceae bacterium]
MATDGTAVLQNVRRYRAIASLYRQAAAFRPAQSWSLLRQAEEWERLALMELETYFNTPIRLGHDHEPQVNVCAAPRWQAAAAA